MSIKEYLREEKGIDEERRVCYVGITRASDVLYLTNAKRRLLYGKETSTLPSRFISEIAPELIKTNNLAIESLIIKSEDLYTDKNDDLKPGDLINHDNFGHGVIINMNGDLIDVAFRSGVKKIKKNHKSVTKL